VGFTPSHRPVFLVNSRPGHFSAAFHAAPIRNRAKAVHVPKLRTHFAEFLNGGSLERLRILSSPTSVGFGTGASGPCLAFFSAIGAATTGPMALQTMSIGSCGSAGPRQPASCHGHQRCRNISLLSIDYAFRPRLRSRLTLGGFTLPRKPWVFGEGDSHSLSRYSCRHSHLYAVQRSFRYAFSPHTALSYRPAPRGARPVASAACLSPVHFRRKEARPVRSYPLFK
jgi:hypothetical protein